MLCILLSGLLLLQPLLRQTELPTSVSNRDETRGAFKLKGVIVPKTNQKFAHGPLMSRIGVIRGCTSLPRLYPLLKFCKRRGVGPRIVEIRLMTLTGLTRLW